MQAAASVLVAEEPRVCELASTCSPPLTPPPPPQQRALSAQAVQGDVSYSPLHFAQRQKDVYGILELVAIATSVFIII